MLSDRDALMDDAGRYLVFHPTRFGLVILIALVVSYGLAFILARFAPGRGAEVFPDSGWYGAFERSVPRDHGTVATVELRDGRVVAGIVHSFTAEPTPVDDREIMLSAPLTGKMLVRTPAGTETELEDQFIMLRGDEIRYITGSYRQLSGAGPAA